MASRKQQTWRQDVDKDDDDHAKAKDGYAWESSRVRSWDQIEEDPETGRLKSFEREKQIARKRRRDDGLRGVRRGIIRFCVLLVDLSQSVRETDLKPSRLEMICDALLVFSRQFFDQNPISQLSIVATRDGQAMKMSNFSSNQKYHDEAVHKLVRLGPHGYPSLQNALTVARKTLAAVPPYGMREVIVSYGSLSTCDPGDIHTTIDALAADKIRCSVVGLAAELHILQVIAKKTCGSYAIASSEDHFQDLLLSHVVPPPTTTRQVAASLIRMGYPMLQRLQNPEQYFDNPSLRGTFGYRCPRCSAWLSEMPSECTLCGLTLVSSPHLARSYHHLFPVPKYIALDADSDATVKSQTDLAFLQTPRAQQLALSKALRCTGCAHILNKETALRLICPSCQNAFCVDCDSFVHDSLHHCPGCSSAKTDR